GSPQEAILGYAMGIATLKARVKVRMGKDWGNKGLVETCIGRVLFNEVLPEDMRFVNDTMDKKHLQQVVQICYRDFGIDRTAQLLDDIKGVGFNYVTKSGISWGMDDLQVPKIKKELLVKADEEVQ